MRALFIFQGAPGSGKSTFVKEHNLSAITLSTDAFREIVSPQRYCIDKNINCLRQGFDNTSETSIAAFDMIASAIQARMQHDEPIIIDSTGGNRKNLTRFLNLAEQYKYPVYFVNFQQNLTLDEILKRNASRKFKAVPEDYVIKTYENINNKFQYIPTEHVITPDDFAEMFGEPIIDGNVYDEIVFMSDLHGHWSKFIQTGVPQQIEEQTHNTSDKKRLFVFCGDMLDRGPEDEAHLMFKFICDNIDNPDVIFLIGNHERHWRNFGLHPDKYVRFPKDAKKSEADIILNSNFKVSEDGTCFKLNKLTNELLQKFKPFVAIKISKNNQDTILFATHAGIHPKMIWDNLDLKNSRINSLSGVPEMVFTHGIGHEVFRSDYDIDIDEYIDKEVRKLRYIKIIQIHGHRNTHNHKLDDFKYSINLDGNIDRTNNLPPVLRIEV